MRTIVSVFALFGLALANVVPLKLQDSSSVAAYMECVKQALDGGLPEAEIPDHNPLVIIRNLTFPINVTGIHGWIKIEPASIGGIVDFETQSEVSVAQVNADNIVYNYKFYWPQLSFNSEYVAELEVLLIDREYEGTIDLNLNHVIFEGVWDLDLTTFQLNNFTIKITAESVDADFVGFGLLVDPLLSGSVAIAVKAFLDSDPDLIRDTVAPGLQKKINEAWLAEDKLYRLEAIAANCNTTQSFF